MVKRKAGKDGVEIERAGRYGVKMETERKGSYG